MPNKNSSILQETEIMIRTRKNSNIQSKKGNIKERKKENKNQSNKKKSIKKIILIVKRTTFFCLICATIVFLMTSPIFNIRKIEITGNEAISEETVISLSQLNENENIFKNTKSKIINNIKSNAYIDNVTVSRHLPDTICINIIERKKTFAIKILNSYAYISNNGYILEIKEEQEALSIIEGISTSEESIVAGNRLDTEDLEKINTVLKIMESFTQNNLEYDITSIDISDKENYSIYIESEKKKVYLGDATNLSNRILYLKSILEIEKQYAGEVFINGNLNNGFQPYFREKV